MQGLIFQKHIAEPEAIGISGWGHLSANNFRIMRLGHVMLWLAETYVESGKLDEARMLVTKLEKEQQIQTDLFLRLFKVIPVLIIQNEQSCCQL